MSKTFLRITNEDLIIGLAYLAAAFSYLAYQNSQAARNDHIGTQACVDQIQAEVAELRETIEADEDVDDLEDEVQGDGE